MTPLCPGPLGLVLNLKFLYAQYLHTVANKAMEVLCNIFPLLARDSALTHSELTLYKLLIRYILTYASPVCSSTCPSTYLRLTVIQ